MSENFISNTVEKKLLGLPVVFYHCNFDVRKYNDYIYNVLELGSLPSNIRNSVIKRRAEFTAGRFLAKTALHRLGVSPKAINIGDNNEPIWPDGIIGSISHTQGYAICATSLSERVKYLGVDIEDIISEELYNNINEIILSKDEVNLMFKSFSQRFVIATIIFSAKESLFKALFPLVKQYFCFKDARIIEVDFCNGTFSIEMVNSIGCFNAGSRFVGQFWIDGTRIVTVVAE